MSNSESTDKIEAIRLFHREYFIYSLLNLPNIYDHDNLTFLCRIPVDELGNMPTMYQLARSFAINDPSRVSTFCDIKNIVIFS